MVHTEAHMAIAPAARTHQAPLTCTLLAFALAAICVLSAAAPANAGPVTGDQAPTARTSIAGGYFPDPAAWPWMTAIVDPTQPGANGDFGGGHGVCSAVLIAPQRVLTAAHCVVGADNKTPRPAGRFQVLVGRRDLTLVNQGQRRNVTGVAVHPKVYLPETGVHTNHAFYDIAVLFLSQPVTGIPAAPIGTPDDWNSWGTVMGFGHFSYDHSNQQYDQYLRAADFDLWSDNQCAPWFADPRNPGVQHYFGTIHVCANNGPNVASVDCVTHGDSGGPLMIWDQAEEAWKLIGITSFYPQYYHDRCGVGGPFGFAWVAGAEMRNWPLTVAHPPAGGGGADTNVDLNMARSQLRGYVRSLIRANTRGKIRGLRRSCARVTYNSFTCKLRFRVKRHRYKGIASIWTYAEGQQAYWTYVFTGKSKRIGCGGCRGKRVKW
jgi:Trypsin